jgi:arabinogalactan endo-1,4-beta-galactosidase
MDDLCYAACEKSNFSGLMSDVNETVKSVKTAQDEHNIILHYTDAAPIRNEDRSALRSSSLIFL